MIGNISANASITRDTSVSGSNKFDNAWEKTDTYYNDAIKIGTKVYGYNTVAIKEDYTWTKGTECSTTAGVYRDGSDTTWNYGSKKSEGSYSKIEVKHKTYYVKYRIKFTSTYTGKITSKTANSSVK